MGVLRVQSGLCRSSPPPFDCAVRTLRNHPLCRIPSSFFLNAAQGLDNCDRRENSSFSTQSANSGRSPRAGERVKSTKRTIVSFGETRLHQCFEQRLGLLQVERVEAFRKPTIDRSEKIAGFGPLALIATEPRQARRRAQLPGLCLLRTGNRQRALEMRFRFRRVPRG
jgi:hypothetical protein